MGFKNGMRMKNVDNKKIKNNLGGFPTESGLTKKVREGASDAPRLVGGQYDE